MPDIQAKPQNPVQNMAQPPQTGMPSSGSKLPNKINFGNLTVPVIGVILVLVVLVVFLLIAQTSKKKQDQQSAVTPGELQVSTPVPGESPPALPAVKGDDKAKKLIDYFAKASPANFKEQFMTQISDIAADKYLEYSQAADPAKKFEAAQSFYIYLNNPAVDKSDPQFVQFLADVKADLENSLGKPLF